MFHQRVFLLYCLTKHCTDINRSFLVRKALLLPVHSKILLQKLIKLMHFANYVSEIKTLVKQGNTEFILCFLCK